MRFFVRTAAGAAVAALALAGCGSSSSGGSSSGSAAGGTSAGASSAPAASAAGGSDAAGSGAASAAPSGGASSGGTTTGKTVKVGLAYDVGGRGDKSFNDLAAAGLDKAKQSLTIQTKELSAVQGETDAQKGERLTLLAQSGYNPIVAVGFAYATALGKVAPKFPKTQFAIVDDNSIKAPNVEGLVFTENQSSFLVGVAAALASKTKHVGFIGGVQTPLIQKFQAGFAAGVKAVDPSDKVDVAYLSQPPDFSGFNDPAKAKVTAQGMYDKGADVVYHAAGGSGSGLFQAAAASKKWAIGVDSDQYQSAPADQKQWILTSALKGVDVAVDSFIEGVAKGSFTAGFKRFDLKSGGVGYAKSNPALQPYESKIDDFASKITSGALTVPETVG
ncbi:nucleoside-binding protein [Motilibacter rhizosphaerae]|uniref:Nucleoside-binding protein n=1 Tax=Motilibacter rhizosphaerae TaxID=598652 RepID=A0A4Q7NT14_9ACTN|nr:BMP family ABC transporter substrate-binding protein [Motilibacter rhizosphaerae]RZS90271.1 nucleoside-binding protein [Motilibacter rhizosphaerae]